MDKDDFFAIELEKMSWEDQQMLPESKRLPPPFDFERLTRFMAYGFIMAPVQHRWFAFLGKTFPGAATVPAMKRVAFDQLLFAPCGGLQRSIPYGSHWLIYCLGLACFFTFMTVAEGGGKRAVLQKFRDIYVPSLKANYIVWPAVQMLNFRIMPVQFQIVRIHSPISLV